MNAKQRRKDNRIWRYFVDLTPYYEVVTREHYDKMWFWCVLNFGNRDDRWREKHGYYGSYWQFDNKEDAAFFALKWLNHE